MGKRVISGTIAGLIIGLLGFFIAPLIFSEIPMHIRFGIMVWYLTMGTIIGGVDLLQDQIPKWLSAMIIGAWLNFVLMIFMWPTLNQLLPLMFPHYSYMHSPVLLILEGMILGTVIELIISRLAKN
jgi:hypothetical protein